MDAGPNNREAESRKWPRHTKGDSCQGCNARMDEAHPELRIVFHSIKKVFPDAHASWVWRNRVQQNQFVNDGASKAPYPTSQHNKLLNGEPCARAFDLFQLDAKGLAMWDPGFFRSIWRWMLHQKLPMRWGGAWTTLGDTNHYELERWVAPRCDGDEI